MSDPRWPELPYESWAETRETLHRWLQASVYRATADPAGRDRAALELPVLPRPAVA